MDDRSTPEWMLDPLVKDIPKEKLDFLSLMFSESKGKSQKELMMTLMPMMTRAKKENLYFTPQEMGAAIAAIRKYSSEEELTQIDKILEKTKDMKK